MTRIRGAITQDITGIYSGMDRRIGITALTTAIHITDRIFCTQIIRAILIRPEYAGKDA